MLRTETELPDALFELICPLSRTWHVCILELVSIGTVMWAIRPPLRELREFSESGVVDIVNDEAEAVSGF